MSPWQSGVGRPLYPRGSLFGLASHSLSVRLLIKLLLVNRHSRSRLSTVAASRSSLFGLASIEFILAASGLLAGLCNGVPPSPTIPGGCSGEPEGGALVGVDFRPAAAARASPSRSRCRSVEMRALRSFRSPQTCGERRQLQGRFS